MRSVWLIGSLVLSILVFSHTTFSQSNAQIEEELVAGIKKLEAYSAYGGSYDEQQLTEAQKAFEEILVRYTKIPSTLSHPFDDLDQHLSIATSDDGRLRIYSWDLEDGGTMHRFGRVYQFRGADGSVNSKSHPIPDEGMGPGFVTDIYSVDTRTGSVYIVCSTFIGSTRDYFQSATLYRISRDTLVDNVRLIRTSSGLRNALSFEYDNFSVIDRGDMPQKLILFDKKTSTLKIPVVIKDTEFPDGKVTDRFISYRYDGRYFVRVN